MSKLVYGVGVNDADYVVQVKETIGYINGNQKQKLVWICPFYNVWKGMLARCYSKSYLIKNPTYKGCFVEKEWHIFSNFKRWMETQDWNNKQLDKDLLYPGNKIYSPNTCVFVDKIVNSFVVESDNIRGEYPIGVYWNKQDQKFMSRCRNPFTKKQEYLGLFDDQQEAHRVWLIRKLELAKLLASEQADPRIAKSLIERYENYSI